MRVLAHPDPCVLEAELLDRIEAAQRGDPWASVLVVVPTRRLAEHARRRIAERSGARIGIEVLVHRSLARRILEDSGRPAPRPAPAALLESLLETLLRGDPENRLASFAADHPGALGTILASVRDLRESRIAPSVAAAVLREEPERSLSRIYAAYSRALHSRGIADDAALVATALPHAEAWARRFRTVLHHGAYELIGIHLDLVRAVDRGCEVVYLLPFAGDGPAYAYAGSFASRHLLAPGARAETIEDRPGSVLGPRLRTLYHEASRPEPPASDTFTAAHAQGAAAEIDEAARRALLLAAESTRPDAVAIVARTLAPYTETLDGLCARTEAVFAPSATAPLRREGPVAAFLLLLRTAVEDFPRAATAELLRSPLVRWDRLAPAAEPFDGALAESWSRRARILGGLECWTHDLPEWVNARVDREDAPAGERARRLARAIGALAARVDAARGRSWSAHADDMEALFADLITADGDGDEIATAVRQALAVLRRRESDLQENAPVPLAVALAFLERVLDDVERPIRGAARGGLPILDAAQARGLTFESVFLAGLNSGVFPRLVRDDPFLGDPARIALRDASGRPIGVKSEGRDEERLLLALVLGAARRSIHLSWQRSDETGRTRASSIAQREIARVLLGRPHGAALRDRARSVPAHPASRYRALAEDPGLLRPGEAAVLLALEGTGEETARRRLIAADAALSDGLELVRSTESFDPGEWAFDGRVGRPVISARGMSVTALETLGRCALRYFFRHGLRVRELDDETEPFGADPAEVGLDVHGLLEDLYATLSREGAFASGDLARSIERARGELARLIDGGRWPGAARIARRLPVLGAVETARWRTALEEFVAADVERLHRMGGTPSSVETPGRGLLDLGDGRRLEIRGRFDRVVRRGDGTRLVGDYKTSGDLRRRVSVTGMLRGLDLQVPLYRWIADADVEVLGVGPAYGRADPEEARREFTGFKGPQLEDGFHETLRVLAALAERGRFPIRVGEACRRCPYRAACRRNHPATRERHAAAADTRDYRTLDAKGRSAPRLADVSAAAARGDEEDA